MKLDRVQRRFTRIEPGLGSPDQDDVAKFADDTMDVEKHNGTDNIKRCKGIKIGWKLADGIQLGEKCEITHFWKEEWKSYYSGKVRPQIVAVTIFFRGERRYISVYEIPKVSMQEQKVMS